MGEFAGKDLRARLRGHVEYLAGTLGERNPRWYANLEKARRYIERMLVDAGYDIWHDAYEVAGRTYHNVIAEAPGGEPPRRASAGGRPLRHGSRNAGSR